MDVNDAIKAAEFVNTTTVVGIHYDTFGYIKINRENATTSFEATGKKLFLPAIGETIDV